MKKKTRKFLAPSLLLIAAVVLVLVGGQSVLRAQQGSGPVINNYAESGIVIQTLDKLGGAIDDALGAIGSRFTNGLSTDSTSPVAGQVRTTTLTATGTSTVQEISLGSRYAEALTFTAGSTTTPGSLTSMQNTGAPKLCTTIELDLTTADTTNGRLGTGHPMVFSVGTSTAATTWSTSAGGLVGTTTVATGTTMLITNTSFPGSATSTPGASWIWGAGVYLLGAFDSVAGDAATSSEVYTGMAGSIYVTCHTR